MKEVFKTGIILKVDASSIKQAGLDDATKWLMKGVEPLIISHMMDLRDALHKELSSQNIPHEIIFTD